ncbi:MAG: universal stress protein [Anaerolineae bacterium]
MRRILVGVDGSQYGLAAVKAAAKLAAERGIGEVTLINVIPVAYTTLGPTPTAAPPESIQSWEVFNEPREVLAKAGVKANLLLRVGDPADEIVRAAKEGGFDLIVVGHRGLSPAKALLLGSVSNHVASHAPCSVLIVRTGLENNENTRS